MLIKTNTLPLHQTATFELAWVAGYVVRWFYRCDLTVLTGLNVERFS